jgi:hypothetical protein
LKYTEDNIAELRKEFSVFEYRADIELVKPIIDLIIHNEFKNLILREKKILLFNLLFLKSELVFDIYCLIRKSKQHKITISISGIKKYFTPLLDNSSKIQQTRDSNVSYFKNETKFKITAKHFINRLYYRVSKTKEFKLKKFSTLIKTWCDVDIKLHSKIIDSKDSFIFIYPFVANIKRGINHIKYVKQNFPNRFCLMGIPYGYFQWIKTIFSNGKQRDLSLLDYEYQGAKNHLYHLNFFNTIYTSEEFMAINFLINKNLQKHKVKIVNIAHGLGLYSPYSCFDTFKTINNFQMRFYKKLSEIKEIKPMYDDPLSDPEQNFLVEDSNFIFIHQNFEDHSDKVKESIYQDSLLEILNDYSSQHTSYIKFHPNTKNSSKNLLLKKFSFLKEYEDVYKKKIFLGTLSTSYYFFRSEGTYILIGENKSMLKNIFGEKNILYRRDELKKILCIQ